MRNSVWYKARKEKPAHKSGDVVDLIFRRKPDDIVRSYETDNTKAVDVEETPVAVVEPPPPSGKPHRTERSNKLLDESTQKPSSD